MTTLTHLFKLQPGFLGPATGICVVEHLTPLAKIALDYALPIALLVELLALFALALCALPLYQRWSYARALREAAKPPQVGRASSLNQYVSMTTSEGGFAEVHGGNPPAPVQEGESKRL